MANFIQSPEIDFDAYVSLDQSLAIGKLPSSRRAANSIKRTDQADALFLESLNPQIQSLGKKDCQLFIQREGDEFFVEDRWPDGGSGFLGGDLFTRRKLLINDRISIGKNFHFLFDGIGLQRVREKQGGQLNGRNLTKTYTKWNWRISKENITAVRNVSIQAQPNEFVGILGPSGCGKSTLLKMLSGALRPTSGIVSIDGIDVFRNTDRIRSMVGVVPQDDIVHPELTVAEAVSFSSRLRLESRIPRRSKEELASQVISDLGLSDQAHIRISELSGGQRKRTSIAVEILKQCDVMFLDEPTSGLDPATAGELMTQLDGLARNGRTILCTTHVLESAYLFDKILFLARGGLVFEGNENDALKEFGVNSLLDIYPILGNPKRQGTTISPPASANSKNADSVNGANVDDEDPVPFPIEGNLSFHLYENGGVAHFAGRPKPDYINKLREFSGVLPGKNLVIDFSRLAPGSITDLKRLFVLFETLSRKKCILSIASPTPEILEFIKENRYERVVRTYQDLQNASQDRYLGKGQGAWEPPRGLATLWNAAIVLISLSLFTAFVFVLFLLFKEYRLGNAGEKSEHESGSPGVFSTGPANAEAGMQTPVAESQPGHSLPSNGDRSGGGDSVVAADPVPSSSSTESGSLSPAESPVQGESAPAIAAAGNHSGEHSNAVEIPPGEEIHPVLKEVIAAIEAKHENGDADSYTGFEFLGDEKERTKLIDEIVERINAAAGFSDREKQLARHSIRDSRYLAKLVAFPPAGPDPGLNFDQRAEIINLLSTESLATWLDYSDTVFVVLGYAPEKKSGAGEYSTKVAEAVAEFLGGPLCRVPNRIIPLGLGTDEVAAREGEPTAFEIWAVIP